MLKYVQKVDEETGLCNSVGVGTNTAFYESIGMVQRDVEQAYDGSWYLVGKVPSKPVELAKEEKLSELKAKADTFEVNLNTDMIIQSSIGFPMNADRRSQQNIQGMVAMADAQQAAGAVQMSEDGAITVPYRCGDNVTRNLTVDQLKTAYMEMLVNGQNLYDQKWAYEQAINSAQTVEEVEAINIQFEMKDFTA